MMADIETSIPQAAMRRISRSTMLRISLTTTLYHAPHPPLYNTRHRWCRLLLVLVSPCVQSQAYRRSISI